MIANQTIPLNFTDARFAAVVHSSVVAMNGLRAAEDQASNAVLEPEDQVIREPLTIDTITVEQVTAAVQGRADGVADSDIKHYGLDKKAAVSTLLAAETDEAKIDQIKAILEG